MHLRPFVFRYTSPYSNKLDHMVIRAVSGERAELELRERVPFPRNVTLIPLSDYYKQTAAVSR